MNAPTPSSRLPALSGLRYLAALTVLMGHAAHMFPEHWVGRLFLCRLSGVGMPLFFTLSGFILTYTYYGAFSQSLQRPLRSYFVARFARIYPVYILCMLLAFSFMGCFFQDLVNRPGDTLKSLFFVGTMTQDWFHISVFQDFIAPRTVALSYLGVAWSVSAECFFYVLFPLVAAFLLPRIRSSWQAMALVGLLAYFYVLVNGVLGTKFPNPGSYSYGRWAFYLSPYVRFGEFLAGCLVGRIFLLKKDTPPTALEARIGAIVPFLALPFLFYLNNKVLATNGSGPLLYYTHNFGFAPLCLVAIYCLARYPSSLQGFFASKPLVTLGEASYVLYLIHPLVQSYCYPRLAGEGPLNNWFVVLFNNLAMFAVMHFIALGVYKYYEDPMRKWLRNTLDNKPVQPPLAKPKGAEPHILRVAG